MSGFILEGWALLGALIAIAGVSLLAGAAIGYFSAAADLQQERAKAWDRGFRDLRSAIDRRPTDPLADARNPYLKRSTTPARPAALTAPDLDVEASWAGAPLRAEPLSVQAARLFDQDAPVDVAQAVELRGDD